MNKIKIFYFESLQNFYILLSSLLGLKNEIPLCIYNEYPFVFYSEEVLDS